MDSQNDRNIDNATNRADDGPTRAAAPPGCALCLLGVRIVDGTEIRACVECARGGRGHRGDADAAWFVGDSLAALAEVRELLWPAGDPDAAWSPDTIDEIAHRLEFLRVAHGDRMADAVRYSGAVTIELSYEDSDSCYDGRVLVDDHTYSVGVFAPKVVGPGIAYDSPEAFDRAAHAALSFAAADTRWADGRDIFTAAAETDSRGWVIGRRPRVVSTEDRTSYYRNALSRHLEQAGWTRVDRRLTSLETPPRDNPTRRREVLWAWLRDALLWSLEELAERRPLYAFRGLLQAAGYAAEVGNDVMTSDALTFLRNAVEDVISGRDAA